MLGSKRFMTDGPVAIMWFRRDLRLDDNAALYHALKSGLPVLPVFLFDRNILDDLEDRRDARVSFIHDSLQDMQQQLRALGSSMEIRYGYPLQVFQDLLKEYQVGAVYTNHDYESYALVRDGEVAQLLQESGLHLHHYKDQVIFEKDEVLKDDGKPYTVFTPYSRKWKTRLEPFYTRSYPCASYYRNFLQHQARPMPSLEDMGFLRSDLAIPSRTPEEELIRNYTRDRDFPFREGTTKLGVHLRFGTISIRKLTRRARELNETFLNELIWRDFYHMILWHFPHISQGKAFRPEYDLILWRNDPHEFEKWCSGQTGYPIVDAGMRQLNATGYMHNRVRMIVASFLSKHLLIDWRWGEAYFARKLLDYDFAANNGGWQWAAGSGCDAAPYFRIFNPYLQTKKFDPGGDYIRRWVPEVEGFGYPPPIVEHEFARKRCLAAYAAALKPLAGNG